MVKYLVLIFRALFKANCMEECKKCLIKARRVAPHDTVVLYNLALVMQQLAQKKLVDSKSSLKEVVGAVRDLELSEKYFNWLKERVKTECWNLSIMLLQDNTGDSNLFIHLYIVGLID